MEDYVLGYIDLFKKPAVNEFNIIYTHGGCYAFYKILKDNFPEAVPYKMVDENGKMFHVISKIGERYYDICGQVDIENKNILPMTKEDCDIAENFRYSVIKPPKVEQPEPPKYTRREKLGIALGQFQSKFNKLILLLFTAFMIQGYQKFYIENKIELPLPICLMCFFLIIMPFVTMITIPSMASDLKLFKQIHWNNYIESIFESAYNIFALIGFVVYSLPAFLVVLAVMVIYKVVEDKFYHKSTIVTIPQTK
jgi:hypothetical protein